MRETRCKVEEAKKDTEVFSAPGVSSVSSLTISLFFAGRALLLPIEKCSTFMSKSKDELASAQQQQGVLG
jgi:hypothetical protein